MGSTTLLLIVGLVFLAGLLLGAYFGSKYSADLQKQKELEKHLNKVQGEFKDYQSQVNNHFNETSSLLRQLAESYKDVHNHLAQGAKTLNKGNSPIPVMETLPGEHESEQQLLDSEVSAPLDYAPKSSPYDQGTLNEEYGLEKVELDEKPIDNIADAIAEQAKTQS